jgi:aminoglycoside 3-N-acetyltransferase
MSPRGPDGLPRVSRSRIAADLRGLGVRSGDALVVHSSLRAIGWVEGGAEAVVGALQAAIAPAGTLAMPTFCPPAPVFVVAETPCSTGAIPEAFRRRADVLRSAHPTHSVAAWGEAAEWVVAGHRHATALGAGSPLHLMADLGAWVLMVGADCRSCSLIHVAEALERVPYLGVPYPGYDAPIVVREPDGSERVYREREIPGDSSNFLVVQEECERRGQVFRGRIGAASCLMVRGTHLLEAATDLLRRDPAALLCDGPSCAVCVDSRQLLAAT